MTIKFERFDDTLIKCRENDIVVAHISKNGFYQKAQWEAYEVDSWRKITLNGTWDCFNLMNAKKAVREWFKN